MGGNAFGAGMGSGKGSAKTMPNLVTVLVVGSGEALNDGSMNAFGVGYESPVPRLDQAREGSSERRALGAKH
jgi:hypothetical protein